MGGSDEAAVAQARAGDREAFRTLVEKHSRNVFRLAFRMTGNEEDAEDVVQETFLRAYRKMPTFAGQSEYSTWLHRIAANCAVDALRRRVARQRQERPLEAKAEEAVASGPLAQSDTPRARRIVGDIARSNSDPELQDKALHYLGIHGGRASRELLAEIYASPSSTLEVRERILKSYMIAGERDRILTAAKTEKDPHLRSAAVRLLGVMGARSELWQLYQSETSLDVKRTALQAMFVAGDSGHVLELARTESQPELKREAIHKLGTMDRQQAGPALVSIYKNEKDPDLRKAALQGLFVQGNSNALVEIARSEKDPELKREAVKKLSVMGRDKEATDYLMELLKD